MALAGSGGQFHLTSEHVYFVYILLCSNNKTYDGFTQDLNDRLERHKNGYVPYTKSLRPIKLLTYINFTNKYKAIAFEKYLKSGSGRAFMKKRLI